MLKFHIITLFCEQVESFLAHSIIKRACDKGIISVDTIDIRDFAVNEYGKVDDTLYGGGTGMLIQCEPVYNAYKSLLEKSDSKPYVIFVSPKGETLTEKKVKELSCKQNIAILCGHYEGIDDRVLSEIVDEEISIGDYVLTGGELAACVIVDSVSRLVEGVLPSEDAYTNESHMNGTLEAPQYTKPETWHEKTVPAILLSGDSAKIEEHNRIASLCETWQKRPDMLENLQISKEDWNKMLANKKGM